MKKILTAILLALALAGCSTTQFATFQAKVDKIEAASQADLQAAGDRATAAAKSATDAGLQAAYTSRAAYWYAGKTFLAAAEAQGKTCAMLIAGALTPPASVGAKFAGPADALEAAAEVVGNISGTPASVKLACEKLPVPQIPLLPSIPKF